MLRFYFRKKQELTNSLSVCSTLTIAMGNEQEASASQLRQQRRSTFHTHLLWNEIVVHIADAWTDAKIPTTTFQEVQPVVDSFSPAYVRGNSSSPILFRNIASLATVFAATNQVNTAG